MFLYLIFTFHKAQILTLSLYNILKLSLYIVLFLVLHTFYNFLLYNKKRRTRLRRLTLLRRSILL